MRRTMTTLLLVLGLGAATVAAAEPATDEAAIQANGLATEVLRISDESEVTAPAPAQQPADPYYGYGMPWGAIQQSAGYFYTTAADVAAGNNYFNTTGGRSPNTWAGPWGYGDDCHVGAARLEYLMWFSRGRGTPPLVTTSPQNTPQTLAGVLPAAHVLSGNEPFGTDMRSGARITLGRLLADERTWLEGRFWGVEDSTDRFSANSNGNPILARPFFNTTLGIEDALLLAYPGITTNGSVNVLSKNDMFAADAWFRRTWSDDGCTRIDFLAGYQFARIDDFVGVSSLTRSIDPLAGVPINSLIGNTDNFTTQNQFHGAQVGFMLDRRKGVWSLEVLGKVGLGNMHQRLVINGNTSITVPNLPAVTAPGGLLTQPSNIGTYTRNQFAAIPELNINLCYNLSPSWKIIGGYTFIYFSDVALAGDQIDRSVNLSQNPGPPVGPLAPLPHFTRSDFLIQGISLGGEYRW